MKKPYLKKYKEISSFIVWIVNGEYIRENINEEFTNYGQHYLFEFIPTKELWIDKECKEGDAAYYVDSMIVMHRLIAEGISHKRAVSIADKIEKRERAKSELLLKIKKKIKHKKELLDRIHRKLLKEYSGEVKVWVVDGELVRDLFFLDFTEGRHDLIYHFVPKNEVWIDDDISKKELKFVLLHELHERNLMLRGWTYDLRDERGPVERINKKARVHRSAHGSASKIEYFCRKHPEKIDELLKKEFR